MSPNSTTDSAAEYPKLSEVKAFSTIANAITYVCRPGPPPVNVNSTSNTWSADDHLEDRDGQERVADGRQGHPPERLPG